MKFSVNSLLFSGTMSTEDLYLLEKVKLLGFDMFEATPVDPQVFPASELRQRAADLELGLNANFALPLDANTISPDPANRRRGVELSKRVVDLCLEAGVEVYCGANYAAWGYIPGHRRSDDEWRWGVESFREIGEYAKGSPIILAVETLNRFESHFLNTAEDAVAFVDAVGLENCKVHLDTFHMLREESDIGEAILATGKEKLAYFHACGSHRGIAGRDLVPWAQTFQALKDINYEYCIGVESFNSNLEQLAKLVCIWRDFAESPDELAFESLAFIKEKTREYEL